jgi:hypothetical protein
MPKFWIKRVGATDEEAFGIVMADGSDISDLLQQATVVFNLGTCKAAELRVLLHGEILSNRRALTRDDQKVTFVIEPKEGAELKFHSRAAAADNHGPTPPRSGSHSRRNSMSDVGDLPPGVPDVEVGGNHSVPVPAAVPSSSTMTAYQKAMQRRMYPGSRPIAVSVAAASPSRETRSPEPDEAPNQVLDEHVPDSAPTAAPSPRDRPAAASESLTAPRDNAPHAVHHTTTTRGDAPTADRPSDDHVRPSSVRAPGAAAERGASPAAATSQRDPSPRAHAVSHAPSASRIAELATPRPRPAPQDGPVGKRQPQTAREIGGSAPDHGVRGPPLPTSVVRPAPTGPPLAGNARHGNAASVPKTRTLARQASQPQSDPGTPKRKPTAVASASARRATSPASATSSGAPRAPSPVVRSVPGSSSTKELPSHAAIRHPPCAKFEAMWGTPTTCNRCRQHRSTHVRAGVEPRTKAEINEPPKPRPRGRSTDAKIPLVPRVAQLARTGSATQRETSADGRMPSPARRTASQTSRTSSPRPHASSPGSRKYAGVPSRLLAPTAASEGHRVTHVDPTATSAAVEPAAAPRPAWHGSTRIARSPSPVVRTSSAAGETGDAADHPAAPAAPHASGKSAARTSSPHHHVDAPRAGVATAAAPVRRASPTAGKSTPSAASSSPRPTATTSARLPSPKHNAAPVGVPASGAASPRHSASAIPTTAGGRASPVVQVKGGASPRHSASAIPTATSTASPASSSPRAGHTAAAPATQSKPPIPQAPHAATATRERGATPPLVDASAVEPCGDVDVSHLAAETLESLSQLAGGATAEVPPKAQETNAERAPKPPVGDPTRMPWDSASLSGEVPLPSD